MTEKSAVTPSAISVQMKKKPGAADGINLGVERSETPGAGVKNKKARGAADSRIIMIGVCKSSRHQPLRGLGEVFV
jgi:hypothetical protein